LEKLLQHLLSFGYNIFKKYIFTNIFMKMLINIFVKMFQHYFGKNNFRSSRVGSAAATRKAGVVAAVELPRGRDRELGSARRQGPRPWRAVAKKHETDAELGARQP
jgi:hypothetical protein